MNKEAVVKTVGVIAICLIAVYGQLREKRNKLNALAQNVRARSIIRLLIVCIQRQNTAGQRIHHVLCGSLHDDIAYEIRRQRTVTRQKSTKIGKLLRSRQITEQQQIDSFLKAKTLFFDKTGHNFLDIIAAIKKLAVAGNGFPVHYLAGLNIRNLCQTCENAFSVDVTQTTLYVIFLIQARINGAVLLAKTCIALHLRCNRKQIKFVIFCHSVTLLSESLVSARSWPQTASYFRFHSIHICLLLYMISAIHANL